MKKKVEAKKEKKKVIKNYFTKKQERTNQQEIKTIKIK